MDGVAFWLLLKLVLHWLGAPPENYYNLGNHYYRAGDYLEAENAYRTAFAGQRTAVAAYFNAGNAAFHRGDYAQAVFYFEAALNRNPDDEDIWHNLELARTRLGEKTPTHPSPGRGRLGGTRPEREGEGAPGPARASENKTARPPVSPEERFLQRARERESRWEGYFSPWPRSGKARNGAQDIFSLPPEELAKVIREQTRAAYPFRPGSSLRRPPPPRDGVDW